MYGSRLVLRRATVAEGGTLGALRSVLRESGATTLFYNRVYEPWKLRRDSSIEAKLAAEGIAVHSFNSSLLYEPWDAIPDETDDACSRGGYGSVQFFMRACCKLGMPDRPKPAPRQLRLPVKWPRSDGLVALKLADLPRRRNGSVIDWAKGIREQWRFGEDGALAAFVEFVEDALERFNTKVPWRAVPTNHR